MTEDEDGTSFFEPLLGDGRPLLLVVAGSLFFAGGFAVFLGATREFLPQDTHELGLTAGQLCEVASCRIVDFMVHDRVAFGGTLAGLAVLYVWLTVFPLARGERWAWWVWLVSALAGFASFLAYLGYGYLDTWHGVGTLLLVPVLVVGMVRSRRLLGAAGAADLAPAHVGAGHPAVRRGGDRRRRPHHPVGGRHRHLRARGPRFHRALSRPAPSDQPPPSSR